MKSQNEFLPKSLAVLPTLDHFNPGTDPADGGGSGVGVSPFDVIDVQLISSNPANPGAITPYTELHLDSPAEGGTLPITANEDTDRVMLLMGLPKPTADWSMSLTVNDSSGTDTLNMQGIEAKYSNLRSTLVNGSNLRHEDVDVFFTIEVGTGRYETYVNINQTFEVVKLTYSNLNTFDQYCVSLIAKANV